MLISLNKNRWLFDWMQDKWRDEVMPLFHEAAGSDFPFIPDIKPLNQKLATLLSSKGYKSKATKENKDLLIFIPDEEYTFIKIKYC